MNSDPFWQRLLIASKPTFTPETTPPFGMITRTLAQVHAQRSPQAVLERIGARALWTSLGTLAAVATITLFLAWVTPVDPERGLEKLAQVDSLNLP